jgi:hypothetical protein
MTFSKKAIIDGRYQKLGIEAARFFASENRRSRTGAKAFQKVALRTLARD